VEPNAIVTSEPRRFYTAWQITAATILGGSLAGGYLARSNYIAFGAPSKANIISVVSVVVAISALIAGLMMPPHMSRTAGALVIVIAYRWYAESAFSAQIASRKIDGWTGYSWWRVIGIAAAGFAVFFLLAFLYLLIFDPNF
jgi:hypothetical protein